jgi:hypothetical protein
MLTINANTLSQIQKQFNDQFPYLKLEFSRKKSKTLINKDPQSPLEEESFLRILQKNNNGLFINEHMSVSIVEHLFLIEYGIATQVLRKSGNAWLGISLTSDWTLKRQNDEGKELSSLLYIKKHQR